MTRRALAARKSNICLSFAPAVTTFASLTRTSLKAQSSSEGRKPWEQKADIYLTCATQNELNGDDADMILAHKPLCVAEVSNMGCTAEAVNKFVETKTLFAPGKAVNAGGVATSGLEMTQNSMRLTWSEQEVDEKLHYIMHSIHEQCVKYGTEADGYIDYVKGANIAGFMKVANAMMAQGVV